MIVLDLRLRFTTQGRRLVLILLAFGFLLFACISRHQADTIEAQAVNCVRCSEALLRCQPANLQ